MQDPEGNEVKLEIFEATSQIPDKYMKIGKYGFLANDNGDLVNYKGSVLTPVEEIASFLTKLNKEEDVTEELESMKGILVVKIFDQSEVDKLIEELKDIDILKTDDDEEPTEEKELTEEDSDEEEDKEPATEDEETEEDVEDEDLEKPEVEDPEKEIDDGEVQGCQGYGYHSRPCCMQQRSCICQSCRPKCYTKYIPTPVHKPLPYVVE